MRTDARGDDGVAAWALARDAVRLLEAGEPAGAAPHTRQAADRLRDRLQRRFQDTGQGDRLTDFVADPTAAAAYQGLLNAVEGGLRDDPDFAREVLHCVNSDCLVDEAAGPESNRGAPGGRVSGRPDRWLIPMVAVAAALIVVTVVVWRWPPERSVQAYCETFATEGAKLHERWNDQNRQASRDDDLFRGIATMAAAPAQLAGFFTTLEKVAPDDIRPDVATMRDAWRGVADRVGDTSADPLTAVAAAALLGLSVGDAERRVDRWTSTHCPTVLSR